MKLYCAVVLCVASLTALFVQAQPPAQPAGKTVIKGSGGSLKGKVTFVGKLPELKDVAAQMAAHTDKACCLDPKATAAEKQDQAWFIDKKTNGVQYVVVWLKAPANTYFDIPDKEKVRKNPIVIDQPFCAFVPHVAAVYPEYFNGKDYVKTGQNLIIKNSSEKTHNANFVSSDPKNTSKNPSLNSKDKVEWELRAAKSACLLSCGIHPWMHAKLWIFDHPYFAVTKEDGNYEIPNVPAGVPVNIIGWHEEIGFISDAKQQPLPIAGQAVTFQPGVNTFDMTVKP